MKDESSNQPSIDQENYVPEEQYLDEMDIKPSNSVKRSPGGDELIPTPFQEGFTLHGMDGNNDYVFAERPQPSPPYVEYTGEESQSSLKDDRQESFQIGTTLSSTPLVSTSERICPIDTTLWMSDLREGWDTEFIKKAFESFGFTPINIKHITERVKVNPYAFVEFETTEIAKKAILKCNGRSIPGDTHRHKFRLSFANLPNQITCEYIVTVNNLSKAVDEAALFKLFGTKYASCRGAKVHIHPTGTPKDSGIIKFSNQTDQQLALIEMNRYEFKGKELKLQLGPTKLRGPKNLLTALQTSMYQQAAYAQFGFMPAFFPPGQFPFMNLMAGAPFHYSSVDVHRSRDRSLSPVRNRRRRSLSNDRSLSPVRERRRRSRSNDRKRSLDKDRRRRSGSRGGEREKDRRRSGRERSPIRRRRSRSRDLKRRDSRMH